MAIKKLSTIERSRTLVLIAALLQWSWHVPPDCAAAIDAKLDNKKQNLNKTMDLTHELSAGLPDFHAGNSFQYKMLFTIPKDGYADAEFTTPEHYGTHVDAPCHFKQGAASIDQLSSDNLISPCVVIDVRKEAKDNPDYILTEEKVREFDRAGKIPDNAAVLLLTGWSQRWTEPSSYRNADAKGVMHFPGFSVEAADFLVNQRSAKFIGIDTLSLDPGNSTDFGVHQLVLGKGLYMIENLDALDMVPARGAHLVVAPLRIKSGTGSPARVFALLP